MQDPVLIIGAGSTGKTAADIFNKNNVLIYGFLDDDPKLQNTEIGSVMVLGNTDDANLLKIVGQKTEAFVAVKNKEDRKRLVELLNTRRKTMPVNAIHPFTSVSEEAILGHGNLVAAGSVIGPFAKIGNHNLIAAGAVIEADASIGNFCEIGSGSKIGSEVEIGHGAFIGPGVTIIAGIKVGKNARIGAGSVIIDHVKEGKTVFGNPAKEV